jgi:hypothetical protein
VEVLRVDAPEQQGPNRDYEHKRLHEHGNRDPLMVFAKLAEYHVETIGDNDEHEQKENVGVAVADDALGEVNEEAAFDDQQNSNYDGVDFVDCHLATAAFVMVTCYRNFVIFVLEFFTHFLAINL